MDVTPGVSKGPVWHRGGDYYFCSDGCQKKFTADPEKYLSPKPVAGVARPGAEYTCPMHPEVKQIGPGVCPLCGMALEPLTISLDEPEDQSEYLDMKRRLTVSALFALPLVILSMTGRHFFTGHSLHRWLDWMELALATPVVVWGGLPFAARFGQSLRNRSPNMFTLIGLGVGVAYLYSLVGVFFPEFFPASFRDPHSGSVGLYFESAAVIVALVLLGQVLELRARAQTGGAIRALLGLAPKTARWVRAEGDEVDIAIEAIAVGQRLRIRPGEKVPVDGVVREGSSAVDEYMISGEAMPVLKEARDKVVGGTINGAGSLLVEATRVGSDTLLAQIVSMVAEAQRSRAPVQKLVDRISAFFVPTVVLVALVTALGWGLAGPEPRWAYAVVNAVAVLIIACPCALGLATPMAIMVAAGKGASLGVLFRDAEAMQTLRKVDALIVDKTGTVTEGRPRLMRVVAESWIDSAELLRMAASLESASEHPLARAIVKEAAHRGVSLSSPGGFQSLTGKGARGNVEGRSVAVGNDSMLRDLNVAAAPSGEWEKLRAEGHTIVFVAIDGKFAGFLSVADPVKSGSAEALRELMRHGVEVIMVTGDHALTAEAVARQVGIHRVIAGVLPAQKVAEVKHLQARGKIVAMAGDGVNDAPALAQAEVGIAMGSGTDVAMKSAGITLVKGDLRAILRARKLSERTIANIRQNLVFAFGYNALGLPLAAGILYPFFGLLLSPMIAAAAMSLSSVSVIGNSLRLRWSKI